MVGSFVEAFLLPWMLPKISPFARHFKIIADDDLVKSNIELPTTRYQRRQQRYVPERRHSPLSFKRTESKLLDVFDISWSCSSPRSRLPLLSSSSVMCQSSSDNSDTFDGQFASSAVIEKHDDGRYVVTIPPYLSTISPFLPSSCHLNKCASSLSGYPSPLHKIHVVPLLTADETTVILKMARRYAHESRSWDAPDDKRHVNFATVDFTLLDYDFDDDFADLHSNDNIENGAGIESGRGNNPEFNKKNQISSYLNKIDFDARIFGALSNAYGVEANNMEYLDLFCASYEAQSHERTKTMDRLELHRDGSLLSFTILLNPPEEFDGGGTIFDALRDVSVVHCNNDTINNCDEIQSTSHSLNPSKSTSLSSILKSPEGVITPPKEGYASLHCGKLLHGGHVVSRGQRIVLVGFVSLISNNNQIKNGVLGKATKQWGRGDVTLFWKRRLDQERDKFLSRCSKSTKGKSRCHFEKYPLWKMKNRRYLPKNGKGSHLSQSRGKSMRIHYEEEKDSILFVPSFIMKNIERRADEERTRRKRLMVEDEFLREALVLSPEKETSKMLND